MKKKLIYLCPLAAALLVGVSGLLLAQADPQTPATAPTPPGSQDTTNQWLMRRAQLEAMRERLEAEVKAQDAELQELLPKMNAAKGDQRIDALAAVVNNLAQQRLMLHTQLESMQGHFGGTNNPTGRGMGHPHPPEPSQPPHP
jgi:hypothetical protein